MKNTRESSNELSSVFVNFFRAYNEPKYLHPTILKVRHMSGRVPILGFCTFGLSQQVSFLSHLSFRLSLFCIFS